jgi:hypothetical protein
LFSVVIFLGAHIILGWILLGLFFFQFAVGWASAVLVIWEWRLIHQRVTGVLLPVNKEMMNKLEGECCERDTRQRAEKRYVITIIFAQ